MNDIQVMTDAYIEAIYFTDTGDNDQPSSHQELTPLCYQQAYVSCHNFYTAVTHSLGVNHNCIDWRQAGHDLWLTRNGHGTGFWDRDSAVYDKSPGEGVDLKTILTAMADAMGEHDSEFQQP